MLRRSRARTFVLFVLLCLLLTALIVPRAAARLARDQLVSLGFKDIELRLDLLFPNGLAAENLGLTFPGSGFETRIEVDRLAVRAAVGGLVRGRASRVEVSGGTVKIAAVTGGASSERSRPPVDIAAILRNMPFDEMTVESSELLVPGFENPISFEAQFSRDRFLNAGASFEVPFGKCAQSLRLNLATGELALSGDLARAGGSGLKTIHWEGIGRLEASGVTVPFQLTIPGTPLRASGTIAQRSDGDGRIALDFTDSDANRVWHVLRSAGIASTLPLELTGGAAEAHYAMSWGKDGSERGDAMLKGLSGSAFGFGFAEAEVRGAVGRKQSRRSLEVDLHAGRIELPAPVSALAVKAELPGGHIRIESASADLLGGSVSLEEPVSLDPAKSWSLPIRVRGLSVAEILKVYPQKYLLGEGVIDGRLTLTRTAKGVEAPGVVLESRAPGGRLQGQIENTALASDALGTAREALRDFRYELLRIKGNLDSGGAMTFEIFLRGSNPGWQSGRTVEFTINLQDNLYELLRTIRLIHS